LTGLPPRAIDMPDRSDIIWAGRVWRRGWMRGASEGVPAYPIFAPDGSRFVVRGSEPRSGAATVVFRATVAPDRPVFAGEGVDPVGRPDFAPDGRALAVRHAVPFLDFWKKAVNEAYRLFSRPARYAEESREEVLFFDTRTGAVTGRLGGLRAGTHLIGYGPGGRTVWTMTHTPDPPAQVPAGLGSLPGPVTVTGAGTLRVRQWAVPTGRPPAWLFGVTALGLALAVADRRRAGRAP
jgi:hypothetical protein